MNNFALIGSNISYSKSPFIYNYWFNKYKCNATYSLIDINNISCLNNIKLNNYLGFNITTPFKNKIIDYLHNNYNNYQYNYSNYYNNTLSCNFIKINNNNIIVKNTDVLGLIDCFKNKNINFLNKNILIIGVAGVTSSLMQAINSYSKQYKKIFLINRTKNKITDFISKYKHNNLEEYNKQKIDIVFNCTLLDINEILNYFNISNLYKNAILFDLNYKYTYTDKNIINGIDMLVFQAKYNFFYWFGFYPNTKEILNIINK